VADLDNHRPLTEGLRGSAAGITYSRPQRTSADGQIFNITARVVNLAVPSAVEETCRFKEITITAAPTVTQPVWLQNPNTTLTIQRVRAN
jgi:hypothetical protein